MGAATYRTNLQILAPRGGLINYGQLSGALPAIELADLIEQSFDLIFVGYINHVARRTAR